MTPSSDEKQDPEDDFLTKLEQACGLVPPQDPSHCTGDNPDALSLVDTLPGPWIKHLNTEALSYLPQATHRPLFVFSPLPDEDLMDDGEDWSTAYCNLRLLCLRPKWYETQVRDAQRESAKSTAESMWLSGYTRPLW